MRHSHLTCLILTWEKLRGNGRLPKHDDPSTFDLLLDVPKKGFDRKKYEVVKRLKKVRHGSISENSCTYIISLRSSSAHKPNNWKSVWPKKRLHQQLFSQKQRHFVLLHLYLFITGSYVRFLKQNSIQNLLIIASVIWLIHLYIFFTFPYQPTGIQPTNPIFKWRQNVLFLSKGIW